MQENHNDGPGNLPAAIKFNDLSSTQKSEVRQKADAAVRRAVAYMEAKAQKEAAFNDERRRLNAEPLTTGAFFLGITALVGVAEEIIARINQSRREGDEIGEGELYPLFPEQSAILRDLVETNIMLNGSHPYWTASEAEIAAYRAEKARILDETATKLFGDPATQSLGKASSA